MPLYIGDYLADTGHLSAVEHGAYLLLLMHYWQRGEPLPNDDERLRRIAKVDHRVWSKVRRSVADFFDIDEHTWTHRRVEQELEHARSKSLKAREAGIRSGESRANKRSTDVQRTFNGPRTKREHPQNQISEEEEEKRGSAREASPQKPERAREIPTGTSDLYDAVLAAMMLDHNCSKAAWQGVQKVVAVYAAKGRTAEYVKRQAEWFRTEHWIGKRGEAPSADNLIDTALQFEAATAPAAPKPKPPTPPPEVIAQVEARRAARIAKDAETAAKRQALQGGAR
jgi:uncharacterized protein YdaU (DUF1376 family)